MSPVIGLPLPPKVTLSRYQEAIIARVRESSTRVIRLVVNAVAGSGKTHTLKAICREIPSSANSLFLAFNKHIAETLKSTLPRHVEVKTCHAFGLAAVSAHLGRVQVNSGKYSQLIYAKTKEIAEGKFTADSWTMGEMSFQTIRSTLMSLHRLGTANLIDFSSTDALDALCAQYGIQLNGNRATIYAAIQAVVADGLRQAQTQKVVDFSDMLWLPHVLDIRLPARDWILIDELQDLSRAQRSLAMRATDDHTNIVGVGDRRQSIQGFAGADCDSVDNFVACTDAEELPLSICYRCPESHIALAQEIVPEIEAREDAPEGVIQHLPYSAVSTHVRVGDMLICRTTAPLIKLCIHLIGRRMPAKVRGRDIANQLTDIVADVAKVAGFEYRGFQGTLSDYLSRKVAKLEGKHDSEQAIEALTDKCDGVRACYESFTDARTVDELSRAIENLFSDQDSAIVLSTVHRAKGLEADRVFILCPEKLPLVWKGQRPEQLAQELNLKYVSLTRSKETLVFVESER